MMTSRYYRYYHDCIDVHHREDGLRMMVVNGKSSGWNAGTFEFEGFHLAISNDQGWPVDVPFKFVKAAERVLA